MLTTPHHTERDPDRVLAHPPHIPFFCLFSTPSDPSAPAIAFTSFVLISHPAHPPPSHTRTPCERTVNSARDTFRYIHSLYPYQTGIVKYKNKKGRRSKLHSPRDSSESSGTEGIIKNRDVIKTSLLKLQPADNRERTRGLSLHSLAHPSYSGTRLCIVA